MKKYTEEKIMFATKATHKLGDLSREDEKLDHLDSENCCVIYGEEGEDYIGHWITGFGFIDVKFPKETTRELNLDEKDQFSKMKFIID